MSNDEQHCELRAPRFAELASKSGEEAAINAGIAADPDAPEISDAQMRPMLPASEALPGFVARWRGARQAEGAGQASDHDPTRY